MNLPTLTYAVIPPSSAKPAIPTGLARGAAPCASKAPARAGGKQQVLGTCSSEAEQASVPGSAVGPADSSEDAEAEHAGGTEHSEMCTYLHCSGSNYDWMYFLECIKNCLAAVWLCWGFGL